MIRVYSEHIVSTIMLSPVVGWGDIILLSVGVFFSRMLRVIIYHTKWFRKVNPKKTVCICLFVAMLSQKSPTLLKLRSNNDKQYIFRKILWCTRNMHFLWSITINEEYFKICNFLIQFFLQHFEFFYSSFFLQFCSYHKKKHCSKAVMQ